MRLRSVVPWILGAALLVMLLGYWEIGVILCIVAILGWVIES